MSARNASLLTLLFISTIFARALGQEPEQELSRWLGQLRDPAPSYRLQAATQLGKLGATAAPALPALFDRLQDIEPNLRLAAIHALAEIAAEPLETAKHLLPLLDDPDEHVRYAAEWAMARIALVASSGRQAGELKKVFEDALARITRRDHHERHRQVIEETVKQLSDSLDTEDQRARSLATELERKQRDLRAREAELERELKLAQQVVRDLQADQLNRERLAELHEIEQACESSDTLGRLKLIHQLAAVGDGWPPEAMLKTRANILKQTMQRSEAASVRYALAVWPDSQSVLMSLFDALSPESKLPDWAASLLAKAQPRHAADAETLAAMATLEKNTFYERSAALDALGRSPYVTSLCVDRLEGVLRNSNEDLHLRLAVVGSLARLIKSDPESLPGSRVSELSAYLLRLLRDSAEDWSLRNSAAEGLSAIFPSQEAAEAYLTAVHLQELDDYELGSVVSTLADFGSAAATTSQDLIARALHSPDDATRYAATEAVAKLGESSRAAVPALLALLRNPEETSIVRLSAVRALAAIGPDAISQLAKQIPQASDVAQIEVLKALSRLGAGANPALETCVELIRNERLSLPVRCAAISVAGAARSKSLPVVDAVKRFMYSDVSAAARATAMVALAKIEGPTAPAVLPPDVDREQPATRVADSYALIMNGQAEGMDNLVAMLQGDANEYAASALEALGSAARQPLEKLLQDPQAATEQRVNAFKVLTRIPDRDYRPLMAAVADDVIGDRCQRWVYDMLIDGGTELMSEVVANLESRRGTAAEYRFEELAEAMVSGLGAAGEDDRIHLDCKLADGLLNDVSGEVTTASSPTIGGAALAMKSYRNAASANYFPHSLSNAQLPPTAQPAYVSQPVLAESSETDIDLTPASSMEAPGSSAESLGLSMEAQGSSMEAQGSAVKESESASRDEPTAAAFRTIYAESSDLSVTSASGPQKVKVYYGTNRAPLERLDTNAVVRRKLPIAVLVAIAALSVCLFGFLRARARLYSLFALAGLGCVAIIGLGRQMEDAEVRSKDDQARVPYGSQYSDHLALGFCEVSIPQGHIAGELESPSLVKLELSQDTLRHVVLERTTELSQIEFFEDMNQRLVDRGRRLLVFIHGYNVSFEDAARRTAQMSHDLEFAGAPVFYSWPSQANWWEYQLDRKNVELSVSQIKEFLIQLAEKSGATTINLVAHSMGNVGLTEALAEMHSADRQALFNEVVLAAPDIDADIFRTRIAPNIVGTAKRLTLYTSSNDLALVASRYFNAGRRVGDSSGPRVTYPGFDLIDASAVDMSFLGHTYYGGSIEVLRDLNELLMDLPTDQRSYLRVASANGQPYWIIDNPLLRVRQPESKLETWR